MQPMMILRCLLSGFVICQMIGNHSQAEAGEFKSEAGISFQYPDDWTAFTELDREKLNPVAQAYLKENPIDLRLIQVMVIRLNDSEFQENFNVVMTPHEVLVSASSIEKILRQIVSQTASEGAQISEQSGELIDVAGRRAISLTHKIKLPFDDSLLQQRQVLIPGGGQTFNITFTALPATFNKYSGTFEAVLQSLTLPPQQSGFNWEAIGRICGVMIGIPIGLFVMRRVKKKWGSPASSKV